jgi:uncharacterized membrane protein
MAIADVTDLSKTAAAHGWWLALLIGVIFSGGAALTGLVEWFELPKGSNVWKTATLHMIAMGSSVTLFVVALIQGHSGYKVGNVDALPAALTFAGFALLTLGGWLGGSLVFRYGMRVLASAGGATRAPAGGAPAEAEQAPALSGPA